MVYLNLGCAGYYVQFIYFVHSVNGYRGYQEEGHANSLWVQETDFTLMAWSRKTLA